jgi:hypothetical protein
MIESFSVLIECTFVGTVPRQIGLKGEAAVLVCLPSGTLKVKATARFLLERLHSLSILIICHLLAKGVCWAECSDSPMRE